MPSERMDPSGFPLAQLGNREQRNDLLSFSDLHPASPPSQNVSSLRLGVATHPIQRFRPVNYWKKFQ